MTAQPSFHDSPKLVYGASPMAHTIGTLSRAPWSFTPFQALVACGLTVLQISQPDSWVVVAALASASFFSTIARQPRTLLFGLGLASTSSGTTLHSVPPSVFLISAILIGVILRSGKSGSSIATEPYLVVTAFGTGAYWAISPPTTHAGTSAAYALTIIPMTILVLKSAFSTMPFPRFTSVWFITGAALSIGTSLLQVYGALGGNYSGYEGVRIFTSAIGSSNFAGAIAIVPGLLLLACAVRLPRARLTCFVIALPFLLAPFVFASRGSVASLAIGLLVLSLPSRRPRIRGSRVLRIASIIGLVALIALAAYSLQWFIWQRFTTVESGSGYLAGRLRLWSSTVQVITSDPFVGIGPGRLTDLLLSTYGVAYSHQFYLSVLAQFGILGGALYLFAIRPRPMLRWTIISPAVVALLVNSAVEPVVSTPIGGVIFAVLVALHWAEASSQTPDRTL